MKNWRKKVNKIKELWNEVVKEVKDIWSEFNSDRANYLKEYGVHIYVGVLAVIATGGFLSSLVLIAIYAVLLGVREDRVNELENEENKASNG